MHCQIVNFFMVIYTINYALYIPLAGDD